MKNIVIDTNVVISAVLSPKGNPAKIITLISDAENIQVFYSREILDEYKRVLAYERLSIPKDKQDSFINSFVEFGMLIEPPTSTAPMPDETDRTFYDTAKTSGAILITGNMKHYPTEPFIVTPTEFLERAEGH